jgi:hypothetical protein
MTMTAEKSVEETTEEQTDEEEREHPAPPPGHPAALSSGCICPVWLNGFGEGLLTTVGAPPEVGKYLQHPDCRLHGTL